MIKKAIICTAIVAIGLGTSPLVAYGTETNIVNNIQVVTPSRDINTSNSSIMLQFEAPEGTKVIVQVYYNNSVVKDKENFVAVADPIEVEMGALGIGWAEVKLQPRRNRIEITAVYQDGTKETIVRMVTVVEAKFESNTGLPARLPRENLVESLLK